MPVSNAYKPDPRYAALGLPFYDTVEAASFPKHILRYRNNRWAGQLGLDALDEREWVAHFGEFAPLPDNLSEPLALRYHGHQFRTYNPQIGDGRGFLFAQMRDEAGRLLDLGTKGSGQTPHSRDGDGRLTLKGGVREALATEMLEALGVYTSKTFSLIETGEPLYRGDEPSPTRSSVLVRLSHSHVRFGTFQRLAFEQDVEAVNRLIDYCAEQFFPHIQRFDGEERAAAFVEEVAKRSARLVASWMAAGFAHGVLNTDNMNVTGESFDYGPYRFIPHADPQFTAAYFDRTGLYAYGRQPQAVAWNVGRLATALTLIANVETMTKAVEAFPEAYKEGLCDAFFARLGLAPIGDDTDIAFIADLLKWLDDTRAPFNAFFHDWFCGEASAARARASPEAKLYSGDAFEALRKQMFERRPVREERLFHPYFSRPRPSTLLIDEIEALWARIAEDDDWSAFEAKLADIAEAREALALADEARTAP